MPQQKPQRSLVPETLASHHSGSRTTTEADMQVKLSQQELTVASTVVQLESGLLQEFH
jgi:hypothetical protein